MAEAAKVEAAPPATADAPKKKGKLLFVILAVVLIGGGAGAWLFLKPKPEAAAAGALADKPSTPKQAALYFKFDPAFVVNFGGEGSARYLQVTVEAMTREPPMLELIKNNEPAVRNDLVLLFSNQDSATLLSPDGKEKLRAATLDAVRKVMAAEGGDPKLVESVYFTSFVVQ